MAALNPLKQFDDPYKREIENRILIENIRRLKIIGALGSMINIFIIGINFQGSSGAVFSDLDTVLRLLWIAASLLYIVLVGNPISSQSIGFKHRFLFFGAASLSLMFSSLITGILSADSGYTFLYIINCMLTASFLYLSFAQFILVILPSVTFLLIVMITAQHSALNMTSNAINIFAVTAFSIAIATMSYQDRVAIIDAEQVISHHNKTLQDLAELDGLTLIPNRRKFDQVLSLEWAHTHRNKEPLSLLMIDVDSFKSYNDTYGHLSGDDCLRKIAQLLTSSLRREIDFACRYGGEEFVILLPNTDEKGGIYFAEQMRQRVFEEGILHENSPFGVITISVGIATLSDKNFESREQFIHTADLAMYESKRLGKNRVS